MELRRVDPRLLKDNPNNPRRTKASREEDAALGASIAAVGILEPPTYFERDGALYLKYGHRRRDGAIATGLAEIEAFYRDEDPENDGVRALAENQTRAALNPIQLTVDALAITKAARAMLAGVLRCLTLFASQPATTACNFKYQTSKVCQIAFPSPCKPGLQSASTQPTAWPSRARHGTLQVRPHRKRWDLPRLAQADHARLHANGPQPGFL
jgi:hypothetical protein